MEYKVGSGYYCPIQSSSEDDIINKNPELWRNGPARHIYDQLGIPENCKHLDYNVVLEPVAVWDPPHVEAEKQRLLELAVQSIIPENENEVSTGGDAWYSTLESDHHDDYKFSPKKSTSTSRKTITSDLINVQASSNEGQRLKMLVSQLEESKAVTKLLQVMDDGHNIMQNESLYKSSSSSDDSYSLVSQIQWENDIIWDAANIKIDSTPREKQLRAGWIASQESRTATINIANDDDKSNNNGFKSLFSYENEELVDGTWENEIIWNVNDFRNQLPQPKLPTFDAADDDIIFKMPKEFPNIEISPVRQKSRITPKKPPLQPHALKSKLLLGKTGFIQWEWEQEQLEERARQNEKKVAAAAASTKENENQKSKFNNGAKINISNDEFYQSKTKDMFNASAYNCRHSRLVKDFAAPFIQTHLNTDQLRNFHRPKLSSTVNAPKASGINRNLHYLRSLTERVQTKFEERRKMFAQGQPILFDREIDISGRDGIIILIENSEEFPPLLSQVGMCSQIINYYKRKSLKEVEYSPPVGHEFGETSYVSSVSFPFLGTLQNGQVLSGIRNNMYHSPIYWQGKTETDFLVIRSKRSGYMIREMAGMFVSGQQCPLIEVPEPNSTKAKNFLKDFVEVFVLRKYLLADIPPGARAAGDVEFQNIKGAPKVRMDVITRHFPTVQETTIKAILKNSSELKRIGNVSWMVKKPEFILPSEEDLAGKLSPEEVCAYYSLLAAEQRLRDAGLDSMLALHEHGSENLDGKRGRKPLNPPLTPKSHQQQHSSVFDEELLSAPWNTTSAFLAAAKGKCLLQVTGPADPTGCGEGYSYVRVAKRGATGRASAVLAGGNAGGGVEPVPHSSGGRGRPRKYPPTKTGGTDADLRKLSTKTAKELLKKSGVPEKEIQKLSRWEIVDLVRTLSTEKVMQGESIDKAIGKFCRWKNIHSAAMNQERYKEACQNVFELQNKVLSSREDLSTDEDDSEDDDLDNGARLTEKDIEQMGKKVEQILCGDTDIDRITHEEEELERLELQKMMLGGIRAKDADIAKRKEALEQDKELAQKSKESSEDILANLMKNPGKALKITRTFKVDDESFARTEMVRDPLIIAAYLRIRNSKSEEFIKQFLHKAERREKKEKKQKERMLLDQLKDMAKIEEKKVVKMQVKRRREMDDEYFPNKEAKREAEKTLKRKGRKCGVCGMPGHVRTSKDCPLKTMEVGEGE